MYAWLGYSSPANRRPQRREGTRRVPIISSKKLHTPFEKVILAIDSMGRFCQRIRTDGVMELFFSLLEHMSKQGTKFRKDTRGRKSTPGRAPLAWGDQGQIQPRLDFIRSWPEDR